MSRSPQPKSRQVRVFVSSTFRDMHAERDHLVTVVFPELRERLERLGLEFFDVDLRWGVPEKDANGETANSWAYCKQWIDRVEPFFVSLLGQRYGYVPKLQDIRDKADRKIFSNLSITEMEIHHAVLAGKLKRRSYFYFRKTKVPGEAAEDVKKIYVEDDVKVEKLKRLIRGGTCPVYDYPCEWEGNRFLKLKDFGERVLEDLWSGVLRDERYVSEEIWRQALQTDPDKDARYTDESQPVPTDLAEKLVALAKPVPLALLDAERQQMEMFAEARLRWFQGRTNELKALTDFVNSTDKKAPCLAAVVAVPGQGKSALLAKLSSLISQLSTLLITHFVGATESSTDARSLVKRLLDELDRSGIEWPKEEDPKQDFNSLCNRLANRLGDYAGERRIIVILDAVNQLSDGHDLVWLPYKLGPQVRIVISCVDDFVAAKDNPENLILSMLERWQTQLLSVPLGALTPDDIRIIVKEYLAEYCKELDERHVAALCQSPQAGNPLYLLVLMDTLRTLGGDDMNRQVPQLIAELSVKHPDTVSLFRWALQRLEVFGQEEVSLWCMYLSLGRVGMASRELADLLKIRLGEEAGRTALLIERGLRRYLQRRGGQLDFFHSQLREAVTAQYGAHTNTTELNKQIADFFVRVAKGNDPAKEWETEGMRGFAECVFHYVKAGQYNEAAGLLTNFPFLLHKLRIGLLEGVFDDYELFRRSAPAKEVKRLEIWTDFFREKAHILRRGNKEWPAHKIVFQLTIEHAGDSPLTTAAEKCLKDNRFNWLWFRRVPRLPHVQNRSCLAVLEGHAENINGALILPDGKILSWGKGTLQLWNSQSGQSVSTLEGHTSIIQGALVLPGGRILSWSWDHTLRVWDAQSGQCLTVFEGHSGAVDGAYVLPDGTILSWSSEDDNPRVWDAQNGKCLVAFQGHSGSVNGALALADGRILSWSSEDDNLRVWDAQNGKCLVALQGHFGSVNGALELADGRILSWSADNTLRLWEARNGQCLAVLKKHTNQVRDALVLPDRRILSWSDDQTLRIWDSHSGKCLAVLEGHTGWIRGALALPDGRILSWANSNALEPSDYPLRLWDPQSGKCLTMLKGHLRDVTGALVLPDGRILSWSRDRTLRLWDAQSGQCLAVLDGHSSSIWGALVLLNDKILSWSEDQTLRLWDAQSGQYQDTLKAFEGHSEDIDGTLLLPDTRILSWGDKTLRLWDIQSGKCLLALQGHSRSVRGALLLADGRVLSRSADKTLRLWDAQSGQCLAVLKGHTRPVSGALVLPDGRILSWANSNGLEPGDYPLRLWDPQSGKCLTILKGHSRDVSGALVLPDGKILSWSSDKTLRLWDAQSGQCLAILEGHTHWVRGALALSEGKLLSWSLDRTLRLWDTQSGRCLSVFEGHTKTVGDVLSLSDGRILSWAWTGFVTAEEDDYTLRLWNAHNGKCVTTLQNHSSLVVGALELANGWLLSWSQDCTLTLWDSLRGKRIEVLTEDEAAAIHPEWLHARVKASNPQNVFHDLFLASAARAANLRSRTKAYCIASWNTDADTGAYYVFADGTG